MNVMKKRRKGQAALEYLVTYGWAILAIVIIAAVLWYLGVFNPGKYAAGKQSGGYSTLSVIDYTTISGSGSGQLTLTLGNAAGSTINYITASVGATPLACTPSTNVAANAKFTCTASTLTLSTGDQINVEVGYIQAISGLAHNETGFVRAV